ncbi:MAG: hypothetical protein WCO90_10425, partial [Planctomycetota bacterium]
ALESGVEWNLVGETSGSGALDRELIAAFDDLWQQATPLSADVARARTAAASSSRSTTRRSPSPPTAGGTLRFSSCQ